MSPPTLYRPGFASYSVKFSPFVPDRLAIATAQYYGVVGNGRLEIVELGPQGARGVREFLTKDGCFDVAWSEANQNLVRVFAPTLQRRIAHEFLSGMRRHRERLP